MALPVVTNILVLLTLAGMSGRLEGQGAPSRHSRLLGLAAGVYATSDLGGPSLGVGAGAWFERQSGEHGATRWFLGGMRTITTRDDAFGCPLGPDCPIAIFPDWLITSEFQTLWLASADTPVRFLAGFGLSVPIGGRENWGGAPRLHSTAGVRTVLRAGIEVGSTTRSTPRIQLTRSFYPTQVFSLKWVDAIVLLVPY